jgi:hypothetical protein
LDIWKVQQIKKTPQKQVAESLAAPPEGRQAEVETEQQN